MARSPKITKFDQNDLRQFDAKEAFVNDVFLIENLGLLILILIQMDACYTGDRNKRLVSIESLLTSFDLGTKIVNYITQNKPKDLYPYWIYIKSADDIINMALNLDDKDFFCDILTAIEKDNLNLTLSHTNIILLRNLIQKENIISEKRGAPIDSDFHKDLIRSRTAIVAGVISAGRKHIVGVNKQINVYEEVFRILRLSVGTVKKHCYDNKYWREGVELRKMVEGVMERVFMKLDKKEKVRLKNPTVIECYMVLFLALFHDTRIWTGHCLDNGIPELKII